MGKKMTPAQLMSVVGSESEEKKARSIVQSMDEKQEAALVASVKNFLKDNPDSAATPKNLTP